MSFYEEKQGEKSLRQTTKIERRIMNPCGKSDQLIVHVINELKARSEAPRQNFFLMFLREASLRSAILTHRGARGAGSAFFSVFASHFHISQPIFKNLQK